MATWVFELLGICQSRQNVEFDSERKSNEEMESLNCNCCVRNQAKSRFEERICTVRPDHPQVQVPTPWIREGYASTSRSTNNLISAQEAVKVSLGDHEDIAQLKEEIRDIDRAIDEGERRIRILDMPSIHGNKSSKQLVEDLHELRAKASHLSAKLRELEALTSPR